MRLKTCPACKGPLKKTTVEDRIEVAGRTFTGALPARVCAACDDRYFEGDVLERFELLVAASLAEAGVSSGDAFRFMRKALGLKAADLAQLLDVAPETLSRWETGKRPIDRAAVATVARLVLDREVRSDRTLDLLRALAHPPKTVKRVRIAMPDRAKRRAS